MLLSTVVCTLALLYPVPGAAVCECGYLLTQTGQRYTHKFHNDFTKIPDTTNVFNLTRTISDWEIQDYSFEANDKTGAMERQNAMSSIWVKDGQLHLLQKGYPKNSTGPVQVAELHSRRQDFFHGSFRASYRVVEVEGAAGGAVASFFFYYDDDNETDIEVLTKDNESTIHYTNHPSYNPYADTLIAGATFADQLAKPWTEFQEHRFDWIEGLTTFYQNNSPQREIRKNVPTHDGKMMLNIWGNNGSWSGPPSTNDVYMLVQYVVMYFNTTASQAGEDAEFNNSCEFAGGLDTRGTICYVTDEKGISSLNSFMSLDPPVTDASERSRTISLALLTILAGGSVFVFVLL